VRHNESLADHLSVGVSLSRPILSLSFCASPSPVVRRPNGLNVSFLTVTGAEGVEGTAGVSRQRRADYRDMISMELPAHSGQHDSVGGLHMSIGVSVSSSDATALTSLHPHSQDGLVHLHNHNLNATTPGSIQEESKKNRTFLKKKFLFNLFFI
jgi:hypothetical protein